MFCNRAGSGRSIVACQIRCYWHNKKFPGKCGAISYRAGDCVLYIDVPGLCQTLLPATIPDGDTRPRLSEQYVSFVMDKQPVKPAAAHWRAGIAKGKMGTVDIGEAEFNGVFHASPSHVIMRKCSDCAATHRLIYYKRLTNLSTFDPCDCRERLNFFSDGTTVEFGRMSSAGV